MLSQYLYISLCIYLLSMCNQSLNFTLDGGYSSVQTCSSSSDILKLFSCPTNSTAFFFFSKFHIDRAFLLVLLVFHTKKNDASLSQFYHNSYVRVFLLAPSCFPLVVVMMFTHNAHRNSLENLFQEILCLSHTLCPQPSKHEV